MSEYTAKEVCEAYGIDTKPGKTKVAIETLYSASATTVVELPEGKTWDDVTDWYVKWGEVHVAFDGGEYQTLGILCALSMDSIDYKRPDRSTVYAVSEEDGDVADYDTLLAKQG